MAIDALWILLAVWILGWVIPVILFHTGHGVDLPWITTWECQNCGRGHIDIRRLEMPECKKCGELNWEKAAERDFISSGDDYGM